MCNEGDGRGIQSIEEEGFANVSRHECEDFKIQEKLFGHLNPNEKKKEKEKSQETTQHVIEDEENVDQSEFHTTLLLLGAQMLQMMTSYVEKIFPIIFP